MLPTGESGQVAIQGTLATSGNIVATGGAHIEGDLSFISATCPKRLERTKMGAAADQVTGPAQWQFQALSTSLQDFIRKYTHQATDVSGVLLTVRGQQNLQADMMSIMKKAIPIELVQTGIVVGVTPGLSIAPVFNYPHHHTMPDGIHTHAIDVPNIKLLDSDSEVRTTSGTSCNTATPQPANTEGVGEGFFGALGALFTKIFP
jgi:hypothetical protein